MFRLRNHFAVTLAFLVAGIGLVFATGHDSGDRRTYKWGSMIFQYPSNWRIEPQLYRTPPEEAAGKPAYPIGLTLFPENESARSRQAIVIGGRQAHCEGLVSECKCLTVYEPIYTCGDDESRRTFDSLVRSVRYSDPKAAFQIISPAAGESVRRNAQYTIRWTTRERLHISSVSIRVQDTSNPLNPNVFFIKAVPNMGRYEWHTPIADSEGPFILEVSFLKPVRPTPPALASGQIYAGISNPFYIR